MTRRAVVLLTALIATGAGDALIIGQSQPVRPSDRQSYTSATTAILVDVVVRDRKGRPVTDMNAAEFSLYEDGTAQKIDTFSRVLRGGGIGVGVKWKSPSPNVLVTKDPVAAPESKDVDATTDDATTALVFDHLGEDALHLAQRATLDYVPMNGESDVHVAVFATEPRMKVLQPYTTDRAAIRQAVEKVMPAGSSAKDRAGERRDELTDRRRELQGQVQALTTGAVTGGAALGAIGGQMGANEAEMRLINLERTMIDSFDSLDRDYKGYDTILSLTAIIRTLANRPGRKSIVFFSEGLPVSPALSAKLDDVIDGANRANVTVYAVDAAGLRAKSTTGETRKEIQEFSEDRLNQVSSGSTQTDQPLTRSFERVEDMVKLDSRIGLARLSEDTGGFLVEQSNNLTKAFKRIDEDNQFHYLLTYTPSNTVFDGKFRTIQVKTHRSGAQVFARKGYRAVRGYAPIDSGGFEVPALAMLNKTPLPNAFPIRAQGFSFPDPSHPGVSPVVVRLSTDALQYSIDADKGTYSAQVAVVARVRDAQSREVQKLSQQYTLSGEAKDLEAAKKGTIIFYREPELPPGVYTLETVVLDIVSGQGSARVSTITVDPAQPSGLGMSSLVLVDHLEQVESGPTPSSDRTAPFYVKNTLVYPNVGDPVARGARSDLPFFFTVYRASKTRLNATAELMKNGQVMASAPVELVEDDGLRLQEIGKLPVASLAPGTYELRIRVASPSEELVRSAFFTVEN